MLLIIFMVAAPLSTVDVNVDLPASTARPVPRPDKPLFLTLKADNSLTLGNDMVARDGVGAALDKASEGDRDKRIFVRADKVASYGEVMEVMNLLRGAGYLKIGLVGLDASAAAPPTPTAGGHVEVRVRTRIRRTNREPSKVRLHADVVIDVYFSLVQRGYPG